MPQEIEQTHDLDERESVNEPSPVPSVTFSQVSAAQNGMFRAWPSFVAGAA